MINKDKAINKIVFTLREKMTVETNHFLAEFRNDWTNELIVIPLEDVSLAKWRANVFCIDGNLFPLTGFYHYAIYQNENQEETTDNLTLLEVGRIQVLKNKTTVPTYKPDNNIFPVYES